MIALIVWTFTIFACFTHGCVDVPMRDFSSLEECEQARSRVHQLADATNTTGLEPRPCHEEERR